MMWSLEPGAALGMRKRWNHGHTNRRITLILYGQVPEAGENQIGCIYSAQGFEFDSVGVIWGPDLVWRDDRWVAQKDKSKDSPVKSAKSDTLRLVKNAYRVLLTRGIKQTRVLCLDEETREHIRHEIGWLNKKN